MFIFGHLGIGNELAKPWSRRLPKFPLFLGMLLPDIIDKTLYYGVGALAARYDFSMGLITCTRTFGHSGLLLAAVLLLAFLANSRWLGALSLGMATHLLLDCLIDRFAHGPSSAVIALTWPFLHAHFATVHFASIGDHLRHLVNRPIIVSELIGLALLGWEYWKSRHRRELEGVLFSRRWRRIKRHRLERD